MNQRQNSNLWATIFVADSMSLALACVTWLALKPTAFGAKHHKMAITSFKDIQRHKFGTDQKPVVIHTNLIYHILYRFGNTAGWKDGDRRLNGRKQHTRYNMIIGCRTTLPMPDRLKVVIRNKGDSVVFHTSIYALSYI